MNTHRRAGLSNSSPAPAPPAAHPPVAGGATILEGFAGAGGLSEALRMLGLTGSLGIEMNSDACATAEAAGHRRLQADIRTLRPDDFPDATVWISGPPCQTYTRGGKQTGVADHDKVIAGIEAISDGKPLPTDYTDPRTPLVLETIRFAVDLPNLRVLIAEQVPAVRDIWIEMCAEFATFHRCESVNVVTVAADDFGTPTRRVRVFLIATRDYTPDLALLPHRGRWESGRFAAGITEHQAAPKTRFPRLTMAKVLGWPAGVKVNTRGARKTAGGNLFSADGPAPALTQSTRSWYRTDLGPVDGRLTPAQGALLQGFPPDYPWQGSRTSQFQRIADTVSPLMGAAVIGATLGLPWQSAIWSRLNELYGVRFPISTTGVQLDLFDETDSLEEVA
ncbi:DNA cytosine methyltransferase [Actinomadura rudentiformis]|uniref:DNA (cytosine-5-)-methyltransferase n=1 Tax=Actinomadura rudentiformis TaxID=359158 RepID=A0A6H9YJW9_9ACTN|nr:DNA cytosine methyltransferase [Actinomadura rudentiformis]KAB2347305.1 DNA cytosine methyltransferase [Actinomadura rudentiformis]